MSKLTLQDLSAVLVDKNGLTPEDAEQFVKTIFDIVELGLQKDNIVKVKGFGTFKIIEVEARESVNVNTGERVVIESHGKIGFSPDQVLKELVNKPFSQFETVVLNDGVDFADVEKKEAIALDDLTDDPFQNIDEVENEITVAKERRESLMRTQTVIPIDESKTDDNKKNAVPKVEKVAESQKTENVKTSEDTPSNANIDAKVAERVDAAIPEQKDEKVEEPAKNGETEKIDVVPLLDSDSERDSSDSLDKEEFIEPPIMDQGKDDEEFIEPPVAAQSEDDEKEEFLEPPVVKNIKDDAEDESKYDEDDDADSSHKVLKIVGIVLLEIVLVCGCFVAGAIFGPSLMEKYAPSLVKQPVAIKKPVVKKPAVVKPQPQKNTTDTIAAIKTLEKADVAKTSDESDNSDVAETSDDYAKCNSANPSVRHGAYKIVGVEKVVTLKEGQTLVNLARKDFGSKDMLCYILAVNNINNADEVKAGQKIKIPKLKLRRKKNK